MLKKNSSIKLIKYYKLINYNLIYNNKAINRYKKDNFEIPEDKANNLKLLRKSIANLKNCNLFADVRFCKRGSEAKNARGCSHRLFLEGARSGHIAKRTSNGATRASNIYKS